MLMGLKIIRIQTEPSPLVVAYERETTIGTPVDPGFIDVDEDARMP